MDGDVCASKIDLFSTDLHYYQDILPDSRSRKRFWWAFCCWLVISTSTQTDLVPLLATELFSVTTNTLPLRDPFISHTSLISFTRTKLKIKLTGSLWSPASLNLTWHPPPHLRQVTKTNSGMSHKAPPPTQAWGVASLPGSDATLNLCWVGTYIYIGTQGVCKRPVDK